MELNTKAFLLLSVCICLAIVDVRARTLTIPRLPTWTIRTFGSGEGCYVPEGHGWQVFRRNRCIEYGCQNGQMKYVKTECIDENGDCQPEGSTWKRGCFEWRCDVTRSPQTDGSVTTKLESKMIAGCGVL